MQSLKTCKDTTLVESAAVTIGSHLKCRFILVRRLSAGRAPARLASDGHWMQRHRNRQMFKESESEAQTQGMWEGHPRSALLSDSMPGASPGGDGYFARVSTDE